MELLSLKETAKLLGYSQQHLRVKARKGEIPCYKPKGGKLFFDKEALAQWIQSAGNQVNASKDTERGTVGQQS